MQSSPMTRRSSFSSTFNKSETIDALVDNPIKHFRRGIFGNHKPEASALGTTDEMQHADNENGALVNDADGRDRPLQRVPSYQQRGASHSVLNLSAVNDGEQLPPPVQQVSAASRVASFFGAGRSKKNAEKNEKSSRRPSTSDASFPHSASHYPDHARYNHHNNPSLPVRHFSNNLPRPSDASVLDHDDAFMGHQRGLADLGMLSPAAHERGGRGKGSLSPSMIQQPPQQTKPKSSGLSFGFGGARSKHADAPAPHPSSVHTTSSNSSTSTRLAFGLTRGHEWPKTRPERNFFFTWESNVGVTEGVVLMGFGGDHGRKRLKVQQGMNHNHQPMQAAAQENAKLPYVVGYERSVLDW